MNTNGFEKQVEVFPVRGLHQVLPIAVIGIIIFWLISRPVADRGRWRGQRWVAKVVDEMLIKGGHGAKGIHDMEAALVEDTVLDCGALYLQGEGDGSPR